MILKNLLKGVKVLETKGNLEIEITSLAQKTEDVLSGSLFFCYKGITCDGHSFADIAKQKGAVAFVVEKFLDIPLPQILVKKTRNIMPTICNNFFNNVTKKLKFIGVTGTNGKTTTTSIIYNILNYSGKKAGLIGTNGIKYCNKNYSSKLTTPDTVELFYLLNKMHISGVEYVIMEVSAHALALNKVKGLKFEVGIFTNLTQDHLDYFKTMHNYAKTKLKFLNKTYCKNIVLNLDDEYGKLFYRLVKVPIITYGLNSPATCFAIDVNLSLTETQFTANVLDEVIFVKTPLTCLFNVYNTLASIITCKLLNIKMQDIINGLNILPQVAGRMNCYKLKNGAVAIIDFAHTPDGLEKVLQSLQQLKNNANVITVFGCGGNRDKTKRCLMGKVASQYSNKIIITNDNPRNEPPQSIAEDILKGVTIKNFEVELSRPVAIQKAIDNANSGDIILIAGKGAEQTQEINNVKYKYNDKDVINNYLFIEN